MSVITITSPTPPEDTWNVQNRYGHRTGTFCGVPFQLIGDATAVTFVKSFLSIRCFSPDLRTSFSELSEPIKCPGYTISHGRLMVFDTSVDNGFWESGLTSELTNAVVRYPNTCESDIRMKVSVYLKYVKTREYQDPLAGTCFGSRYAEQLPPTIPVAVVCVGGHRHEQETGSCELQVLEPEGRCFWGWSEGYGGRFQFHKVKEPESEVMHDPEPEPEPEYEPEPEPEPEPEYEPESTDNYVYFVKQSFGGRVFFKIGVSSGRPKYRLSALQTGNPIKLELLGLVATYERAPAMKLEKELHKRYEKFKQQGEWYEVPEWRVRRILEQRKDGFFVTENEELTSTAPSLSELEPQQP